MSPMRLFSIPLIVRYEKLCSNLPVFWCETDKHVQEKVPPELRG